MKEQNGRLAIASVPIQTWGELYDQNEALKTGTIFKELDMPFFAADQISTTLSGVEESLKGPKEQKWNGKMREIQQVSFVVDDLRLYLDTHPEDQDGLTLLKQVLGRRKQLMTEFAAEFYPLTLDCMADIYESDPSALCYCWQEGPAPWEGVCD